MKVRGAVLQRDGQASAVRRVAGRSRSSSSSWTAPGPGEVLIRVHAAGLCHSDLSVIDGSRPRVMPMVLGHEAAGEVVELGEGVERFARRRPRRAARSSRAAAAAGRVWTAARRCASRERVANAAGTLLGGAAGCTIAAGAELHHHLGVSAFAEARRGQRALRGEGRPRAAVRGRGAVRLRCPHRRRCRPVQRRVAPGRAWRCSGWAGSGSRPCSAPGWPGASQIVAVDVVQEKLELAARSAPPTPFAAGGTPSASPRAHRGRSRAG